MIHLPISISMFMTTVLEAFIALQRSRVHCTSFVGLSFRCAFSTFYLRNVISKHVKNYLSNERTFQLSTDVFSPQQWSQHVAPISFSNNLTMARRYEVSAKSSFWNLSRNYFLYCLFWMKKYLQYLHYLHLTEQSTYSFVSQKKLERCTVLAHTWPGEFCSLLRVLSILPNQPLRNQCSFQ